MIELQEVDEQIVFEATEYKVSTITATGSVHCEINLPLLFNNIRVVTVEDNEPGIIYIEYGSTKSEILTKGSPVKKKPAPLPPKTTPQKTPKRFDNQATIVMRLYGDKRYFLNMKVFKNGNVQITGIKVIDDGHRAIDNVIAILRGLYEQGFTDIVNDIHAMANMYYAVRLINSDFGINFEVRREILHQVLVDDYGNRCSYEPCIYPGVKLQFFWNAHSEQQNGNCICPGSNHCVGKGDGRQLHQCKKITIAIFQSGRIIITGAVTLEQIDDCYQYICYILKDNLSLIKKKKFVPVPVKPMAPPQHMTMTKKPVAQAQSQASSSRHVPQPAPLQKAPPTKARVRPMAKTKEETPPLVKRKIYIKKNSIVNFEQRKHV